jgi:microcystin degradation protein MlrC
MRNLGLCAVIEIGYVQILITSKSENAGDLQFYRGFGIEPTLCRLVSVKACSSLRASYDPISSQVINTDTPGAAGPNLLTLPFQHLPKPFYPFQEISEEHIGNPEVF